MRKRFQRGWVAIHTDSNQNIRRRVWLNGHKIGFNYLEFMFVNCKDKGRIDSSVD
jgi:hypothetical protein